MTDMHNQCEISNIMKYISPTETKFCNILSTNILLKKKMVFNETVLTRIENNFILGPSQA